MKNFLNITSHVVSKIPEYAIQRAIKWATKSLNSPNKDIYSDNLIVFLIGLVSGLLIGT